MWTSWRSRALWAAVVLLLPVLGRTTPVSIVHVNVTSDITSGADDFTAGASTTTGNNGNGNPILQVICFIPGPAVPDVSGETVTIHLEDNGQVIPGAMSTLTFNIVAGQNSYLGASGVAGPQSFTIFRAGSNLRFRASASGGGLAGGTGTGTNPSNSFTVLASTASRVVPLAPGHTLDRGKDTGTGQAGTADIQEPGRAFTVTVHKTDTWFNPIATAGPTVRLTSTDLFTQPLDQALAASGQGSFSVRFDDSRKTVKLTADDITTSLASGDLDIVMAGPEKETVFPYPSPYNPRTAGPMHFKFRLNEAGGVTVIVKDRFGQDVWHTELTGVQGPNTVDWDGRNENGHIVAAGVYYVLLEVGGEIKSKKQFGVVK